MRSSSASASFPQRPWPRRRGSPSTTASSPMRSAGRRTRTFFAAGDVASFHHPVFDRHVRLESWRHADVQPDTAAQAMLGAGEPYAEIPWLWSDQHDLNLQVTGLTDRYDAVVQRGGDVATGVVCLLLAGERLIGACGVGIGGAIGRDIRVAQRLIERGQPVDRNKLGDTAFPLKQLLRAQ